MEPTPYPSALSGTEKPKNYLTENIISTVAGLFFCCGISTITGVIGIVFSTQVDTKYNAGDQTGADSSANTAKILFYVTAGLCVAGLVTTVVYFFLFGATIFSALQQGGGFR